LHHRSHLWAHAGAAALTIRAVLMIACVGGSAWAQTSSPKAPAAAADRGATTCIVAARPNSLWSLAQCCSRTLESNPGCRIYDAAGEYIILKDNSLDKPAAYLIIPSVQVTGIEDKQIFSPPIVNFWEYGWQQAQRFVKEPAAKIALAINSTHGRTQNQLHIHIACVSPAVARALAAAAGEIGDNPATAARLTLGPANHIYRAIKVNGLAGADSPFTLVAAMPGAAAEMGDQSIAVVGSTTSGIYYVLDIQAQGANPGAAEELLDQTCGG
jgi:CDP-diacylglycerol pyrophosphatase